MMFKINNHNIKQFWRCYYFIGLIKDIRIEKQENRQISRL
jgi:hypothetical protein